MGTCSNFTNADGRDLVMTNSLMVLEGEAPQLNAQVIDAQSRIKMLEGAESARAAADLLSQQERTTFRRVHHLNAQVGTLLLRICDNVCSDPMEATNFTDLQMLVELRPTFQILVHAVNFDNFNNIQSARLDVARMLSRACVRLNADAMFWEHTEAMAAGSAAARNEEQHGGPINVSCKALRARLEGSEPRTAAEKRVRTAALAYAAVAAANLGSLQAMQAEAEQEKDSKREELRDLRRQMTGGGLPRGQG